MPEGDPPDGAMVIRCVAVFVGIYQASTVSLSRLKHFACSLSRHCHMILSCVGPAPN